MKKISRKDLQGLRQQFPVLTKELMQSYVGGLAESYLDPNWLFSDPDFTDFGINSRSSSGYGGGGGGFGGNPYGYTDGNLNLPPMDDYYPVNGGMLDEVTIYGNKFYNPTVPNKPDIPYSYPEIPDKLDPINPNPNPKPKPDDDDYPGPNYYYDDWGNNNPTGNGPGWGGYPGWNWSYIGGYYENNAYTSSGGGGGGSWDGGSPTSDSLKDGVNISNTNNFTFNTTKYVVFHNQLTEILQSNSQIKKLLSFFNNGYLNLTFEVGKGDVEGEMIRTSVDSPSRVFIKFNVDSIDKNGWADIAKSDNIDYDWVKNKVTTREEALVVALTHEAIHANHFARVMDALAVNDNIEDKAVDWLLKNGYSQEFVNAFFVKTPLGWKSDDSQEAGDRMHAYMKKYDHGVIDDALNEYRSDHGIKK